MVKRRAEELERFAREDGFCNFGQMITFWEHEHSNTRHFDGVLVTWEPIT